MLGLPFRFTALLSFALAAAPFLAKAMAFGPDETRSTGGKQ
jgi:hypothetical protein